MDTRIDPSIAPALREVVITRIFDAPRDLVFAAWTRPEHLREWWGPRGFTAPHVEIDLRPGGRMNLDMQAPDGTLYPGHGIIREIVPPARLVVVSAAFEDADGKPQLQVLNTITFEEQGTKTKFTLRATVIHAGAVAVGPLSGMNEGWNQSLDKLGEHLAKVR